MTAAWSAAAWAGFVLAACSPMLAAVGAVYAFELAKSSIVLIPVGIAGAVCFFAGDAMSGYARRRQAETA